MIERPGTIHSCLYHPSSTWVNYVFGGDNEVEEGRGGGNQTTQSPNFLLVTYGGLAQALDVDFSEDDSDTTGSSEPDSITITEMEQREGRNRSPFLSWRYIL